MYKLLYTESKKTKWIKLVGIALVIVAFFPFLLLRFQAVLDANVVQTNQAISELTPTPTPLPTAGTTSIGTKYRDVKYNSNGKILSAYEEQESGLSIKWVYVYDDDGAFLYRMQPYTDYSGSRLIQRTEIPGSNGTPYSHLNTPVLNCAKFTLSYWVKELRNGDYTGPRLIYIGSILDEDHNPDEAHEPKLTHAFEQTVFSFEYEKKLDDPKSMKVSTECSFPSPVSFCAFGAVRENSQEKSSFDFDQSLSDIWIADTEHGFYIDIVSP